MGIRIKCFTDLFIFSLGPKKAIVRQGHDAESFYFILAGTGELSFFNDDLKIINSISFN